jgi:hypothetical protein
MKHKIIIWVFVALFGGLLNSCKLANPDLKVPVLYVVNGTNYAVNIYCDNILVASTNAHGNSGKIELNNTGINVPVYVEAEFYDNKGNVISAYNWSNYYFRWNKSYKMTLTNSSSNSSLVPY